MLTLGIHPERPGFFCRGPVLDCVQLRRMFPDSKTFVDMPMREEPHVVEERFNKLPRNHKGEISYDVLFAFVKENFDDAGSDLEAHPLPPHGEGEEGEFLPHLTRPEVRKWADYLRDAWSILSRKTADSVEAYPWRHSLIHLPHPQIVPGERFREAYYWDSYWVVRGLLVCDQVEAARNVVYNLLSLVERFGFVPNGGRAYYLNRSQPPLLSRMVYELWTATGCTNFALVEYALPLLQQEHGYFTAGGHNIKIRTPDGTTHELSRYWAHWTEPRPESYREDVDLAEGAAEEEHRPDLYRHVASACVY